jgi:RNA polymerase sigma-70 factor (ECF subfamily)
MLDASVATANSALQRARETLETRAARWRPKPPEDDATRRLLSQYVEAWERADIGALVCLLHEEATLAMPPLPLWLSGPHAIGASIGGMVFRPGTAGVFRLVETEANGLPAFAAYAMGDDGEYAPMALHVLSIRDGRIDGITAFMNPAVFSAFDVPERLTASR